MPALYLTESDVMRLIDIRLAIDVMEEMFRKLAAGEAMNVPRQRAKAPGIVLHSMSAAAPYLGLVGWKCYTTTKIGARFLVGLYEAGSGELAGLIEADRLGQLRTGAVTAVAARHMALPDAAEVGIFGAGHQAETQLAAVASVRELKRAFVYSRTVEKRQHFAAQMAAELGFEVVPVNQPDKAAAGLPIVITATTSAQPVFTGQNLAARTFVAAVGSNSPSRAEIDATVFALADNIVCDSVEACRNESGDFVEALEKGVFDWPRAVDLCDVVSGRAAGRNQPQSITLFKSVGLAIEDVALGGKLLALARQQNIGRELPF